MKTNQQPLPTSPKGRSFLRSKAPSKSGWCAGSSLPFGKGWGFKSRLIRGWASVLCIMLLTPLLFLGEGLGVRCFAQVANGTGAGNCLSYDGTNNYVQLADISDYDFQDVFTVSCWVMVRSFPSGADDCNRQVGIVGNSEYGWKMVIYPDGKVQGVRYPDNIGTGYRVISSLLQLNMWYHIALVQTNTNLELYFNGKLISTTPTPILTTYYSETDIPTFGRTGCGAYTYYLDGKIDEVRIWNRALTETEIRDNMCKKLTGNESGLVGYWRFDEGGGSTAYDASPNGNDGTLY